MTDILPHARPGLKREAALEIISKSGPANTTNFALLGIRGYFKDTMGAPGVNDIGIYDDAIILVTPTKYLTFNANTDPSVQRPGMATLNAGTWRYKLGIHGLSHPVAKQYEALVQASEVSVSRNGKVEVPSDYYGINIHHGGYNTTTSEGCQTIYPEQWPEFLAAVKAALKECKATVIPYILVA